MPILVDHVSLERQTKLANNTVKIEYLQPLTCSVGLPPIEFDQHSLFVQTARRLGSISPSQHTAVIEFATESFDLSKQPYKFQTQNTSITREEGDIKNVVRDGDTDDADILQIKYSILLSKGFSFDAFNFSILKKKLVDEFLKSTRSDYVEVNKVFLRLATELCRLPFNKSTVELTPANALKFTFTLEDNKVLMVSKSLNDYADNIAEDIVIFSVFNNGRRLVTDATEIKQFVKGFNQYLSS